jgi:hypothetical protein
MTQLKTVQEPMKWLSANIPTNTTTIPNEAPTATAPSGAGVILNSSLNYIKIVPMLNALATSQTIRVTGWSKAIVGTTTYYVPQLLFYGSITALNTTATALTLNSVTLLPAATITKTQGDAKIYNSTSINSTSLILVDTLGCEFVEVEYFATGGGSGTGGNIFYGAI